MKELEAIVLKTLEENASPISEFEMFLSKANAEQKQAFWDIILKLIEIGTLYQKNIALLTAEYLPHDSERILINRLANHIETNFEEYFFALESLLIMISALKCTDKIDFCVNTLHKINSKPQLTQEELDIVHLLIRCIIGLDWTRIRSELESIILDTLDRCVDIMAFFIVKNGFDQYRELKELISDSAKNRLLELDSQIISVVFHQYAPHFGIKGLDNYYDEWVKQ